jgi:hypothetical protein
MTDDRVCDDCACMYDADTEGADDMCGHCMIPEDPNPWNNGMDPFEVQAEIDRRWGS